MTTISSPSDRPVSYRRRRVRSRQRDVAVANVVPLAELAIYDDLILLKRRLSHGGWRSYPVDAAALAQVLARVPSSSGLLPEGVLGTGVSHGQPFVVQYIAAGRRRVQLPGEILTIPLPPLVWAWRGSDYRVFALDVARRPQRADLALCVAPLPNTYEDGRICWGDVERATLARLAPDQVLKLYLEESVFNLHLAGGKSQRFTQSVIAQWRQLVADRAKKYPLADLVPAGRDLAWLLRGDAWT
jgi:PRTRC genetic system protein B